MVDLQIGDNAPDFEAPTDGDGRISLSDLKGQYIILYFYPKDDTPGCTKEACSFQENLPNFKTEKAIVIGVSKDKPAKHDKFKEKHGLDFPLISDEEGAICEAYGTWVEKSMYGRKYMGIDRATFLIGPDGKILEIWRKVKVPGHVEAVLATLNENKKAAA